MGLVIRISTLKMPYILRRCSPQNLPPPRHLRLRWPCKRWTRNRELSGDSSSSRVTTNKVKSKSADWTVNESKDLIRAWGPHYEKLKGVSNKDRARIWNEIYEGFRNKGHQDNGRVLPQVKKRIQNLEYEFKQLKLRASNTGEEGLLRIKQNFPYYDMLDDIMGYRDSVNPDLMEIESSSFLPIRDCPVKSSESSTPTPPPPSNGFDIF